MSKHRDTLIRERKSRGYLVSRIADDLGISTDMVRKSLARTAAAQKAKEFVPNQVKEARKLLAEGYDPDVVMANFGDLL